MSHEYVFLTVIRMNFLQIVLNFTYMKNLTLLELVFTCLYILLAIFLVLILFIKPPFLEPVTSWIHSFGVVTIGGVSFSLGGTLAMILFFGFVIPSAYKHSKKNN